ncbi:uncharacterized protein [Ambystoma mexicanum]|uniref:uncharacterized protein n=1 Tax=Ambystoma mexicanum TaxID=8296 RepID=UPI0037E8E994
MVIKRLETAGLEIHRAKCEFLKEEIIFFEYVFNSEGISADPHKVADIKGAIPPNTPTEVRSFLGMATYCGRFILNLATISEPLRELTRAKVKWDWSPKCEEEFERIKASLLNTTMVYYDQPYQQNYMWK